MNVMALALLATAGFLVLSGRGGGEIDDDEYLRRTAALQQVGHPGITG